MKLGDRVQFSLGVANLEKSLLFYTQLGFQTIEQGAEPHPWAQLTDGQHLLSLNQDGNIYIGLSYLSADAEERLTQLETMGIKFLMKEHGPDGQLQFAVFSDPNGLLVALVNQDPTGMYQPAGKPSSKCGKFGEFALAVQDYDATVAFWGKLGFTSLHTSTDPYAWGILSDEMMVLGLHQTADFTGVNMTYFAGDMPERLAKLHEAGFELGIFAGGKFDGEGPISNAVLTGPDGERLFLFEGEI